jgi:hypothetical protein
LTAFAQFSRAAAAWNLPVNVEDTAAFDKGAGRFFVHVGHADNQADAIAVVRAVLDQAPDAATAFALASVQE